MSDNNNQLEIEVTISNIQGLHARPVMRFVDLAAKFDCEIQVHKDTRMVDGKSPMEMMLLEATQGTVLRLVAKGTDAGEALTALRSLVVDEKFGED